MYSPICKRRLDPFILLFKRMRSSIFTLSEIRFVLLLLPPPLRTFFDNPLLDDLLARSSRKTRPKADDRILVDERTTHLRHSAPRTASRESDFCHSHLRRDHYRTNSLRQTKRIIPVRLFISSFPPSLLPFPHHLSTRRCALRYGSMGFAVVRNGS